MSSNYEKAAEELSQRVQLVMQDSAQKIFDVKDVAGVGVAWRQGALRFVVQTNQMDGAGALRASLPDQVLDFPVFIEHVHPAEAAGGDVAADTRKLVRQLERHRRFSWWQRIVQDLPVVQKWILLSRRPTLGRF